MREFKNRKRLKVKYLHIQIYDAAILSLAFGLGNLNNFCFRVWSLCQVLRDLYFLAFVLALKVDLIFDKILNFIIGRAKASTYS